MKKASKVIVFLAMIVLSAALVFAQQSNADKATFGEFGTDVDNYLDTVGWKDVEMNNIFAFTRLGSNIGNGMLDLGAGVKAGNIYIGLYYTGQVVGQQANPYTGKAYVSSGSGTEAIDVREHRKANPNATYGALVGLSNGMGIKFKFDDFLVVNDGGLTPGHNYGEMWKGNLRPYLELGGLGALKKIGLGVDIVYNRTETIDVNSNDVYYETITLQNDGSAITDPAELRAAAGNYVEPDIYLKFGSGNFTLENNLSFRIYGLSAYDKNGKPIVQPGVGFVSTTYNPGTSNSSTFTALYDNRFFIQDIIAPSYNISGEAGKLNYSITGALPITIGVTSHALSAIDESGSTTDKFDDFYKSAVFNLAFTPQIAAGLKYQLLEVLAVQCGLSAEFFTWDLNSETQTKVSTGNTSQQNALTAATGAFGVTGVESSDAVDNYVTFFNPKVSVGLGATFTLKNLALDFVFVQELAPSIPGAIYQAVGDGLGNNETSIVLSMKF